MKIASIIFFLSLLITCLGCASSVKEPTDEKWAEKTTRFWDYTEKEEYEKALSVAKEQVESAEREFPQSSYMAFSYDRLGFAYRNVKQYQEAEHYLKKSLALAKEKGYPSTAIYKSMALVYQETNREDLALSSIREALRAFEALPEVDSSSMYEAKVILAQSLTVKQDYDEAIGQLKEASDYGISSGDSALIMRVSSAFVDLSLHLGHYEAALRGAEKVLAYYERNNKKQRYANALNNLGGVYYLRQDYKKAIEYFNKAAEFKLAHFGDSVHIATQLKNMAMAYENEKDSTSALYYYRLYNSLRK